MTASLEGRDDARLNLSQLCASNTDSAGPTVHQNEFLCLP